MSSHGSIVICHSSFMILVSISIKYWLLSLILLLQVVYRHSWDYRFQVFKLTKLSIEDIQLIGLSMWLSHIYCVDWIPVSKIVSTKHTFNFELVLILQNISKDECKFRTLLAMRNFLPDALLLLWKLYLHSSFMFKCWLLTSSIYHV